MCVLGPKGKVIEVMVIHEILKAKDMKVWLRG